MAYDSFKGCNLEVSKGPAELGGCRIYISKRCTGAAQKRRPEGTFYRPIIHTEFFRTNEECTKRYNQIKRRC